MHRDDSGEPPENTGVEADARGERYLGREPELHLGASPHHMDVDGFARIAFVGLEEEAEAVPPENRWQGGSGESHCHEECDLPATGRGAGSIRATTAPHSSIFNAEMNASCGMSTFPNWRIFFLPAFCLSSSLRLRVASPP